MAGTSHDVLVRALRDDPSLLRSLLVKVTELDLPGPLQPLDSTVRLSRSAEVRPDVVGRTGASWVACEVQNKVDPTKERRWPLVVAVLHDETGQMGEIVIITASAAVARWAATVAHVRGPVATSLRLSPLVLLLDGQVIEKLLDPTHPELALCAAWAMQHRHGSTAERVVERAVEVTETLPEALRWAQLRAIFSVLSARLRARLESKMINPDNIPETPAVRRLRLMIEAVGEKRGRAEGEAKGRAAGLLLVLEQRGLAPTAAERARICQCSDIHQLDAWLRRALTAKSAAEALAAEPPATPPTKAPAKRRTTRRAPANAGRKSSRSSPS